MDRELKTSSDNHLRPSAPSADQRGLDAAQIEAFHSNGFLAPLDALSSEETSHYSQCMQQLLAEEDGRPDAVVRFKPHLRRKWVSELVHHPAILDAAGSLLGPNLLSWRVTFFVKPAGADSHIAWHQDSVYYPLKTTEFVTIWLALTDSGCDNGCVRVIPASHREGELAHAINLSRSNALLRGQAISTEIDEERAVDLELRAGQMSLHHGRVIHGSRGNPTATARVGLVIRYASPQAAQAGRRQSATLVRGEDREGRFEHDPVPRYDDDPITLAWHARSARRYMWEVVFESLRRPTLQGFLSLARMAAKRENLLAAARLLKRRVR